MPRLPRHLWPLELRQSFAVKGVFVGGCVQRKHFGKYSMAYAHAHHHSVNHEGWICFRDASHLSNHWLVLHELAHLVARQGHTAAWRKCLLKLGGTLDKIAGMRSYHPRERRKRHA